MSNRPDAPTPTAKAASRYQEILQREITRKQFLQMLGVGAVSVLGFHNLVELIIKLSKPAGSSTDTAKASGFGGGRFGV